MLFNMVVENPRMKVKKMARLTGLTGRGQTASTIAKRLKKMYELKISLKPKLALKTFENTQATAYFCRKIDRRNLRNTFYQLHKDTSIDYVLFLAGWHDFFIKTREKNVDFEKYGLGIEEKCNLYTMLYTIPRGWNTPIEEAFQSFSDSDFEKGFISRDVNGILEWSNLDWKIYYAMREDVRSEFTHIGEEVSVASFTVKSHFYKYVLPCCNVAHYFFPKGYNFYKQAFLKITTKYEKGIVRALEKLPCTTYVIPLEKGLILNIFHEGVNELMTAIQKIEEIGILDTYSLQAPLTYSI